MIDLLLLQFTRAEVRQPNKEIIIDEKPTHHPTPGLALAYQRDGSSGAEPPDRCTLARTRALKTIGLPLHRTHGCARPRRALASEEHGTPHAGPRCRQSELVTWRRALAPLGRSARGTDAAMPTDAPHTTRAGRQSPPPPPPWSRGAAAAFAQFLCLCCAVPLPQVRRAAGCPIAARQIEGYYYYYTLYYSYWSGGRRGKGGALAPRRWW